LNDFRRNNILGTGRNREQQQQKYKEGDFHNEPFFDIGCCPLAN